MTLEWIHPVIFFWGAAFVIPFLKESTRQIVQGIAPLLAFLSLAIVSPGDTPVTLGFPARIDRLSLLFGYVFTLSSFIGMIYALHVKQKGEVMAMFVYAGASLSVVFADNLWDLFLCWEMMAFSSVFLVWFSGEKGQQAGMRYLMVHIFGGICLFTGIIFHVVYEGTLTFAQIPLNGIGPWLILFGVLVNVAVIPVHAWLSDAYPEATLAGAVFMSALTTKTAVYVLIRSFSGADILIPLGIAMTLYGAVYAVLENDIRRVLAYGIISQVGYMVTGIGMGGELALNGASAHAFAHILYKGLLMMAMGMVIYMTGKRKLTELGGMYKTAPLLFGLYSVGALSIAGFPLFSGFVTKSMIISAAGESHHMAVMLILTLVSSGTFLYTGLRLPYFIFFGEAPNNNIDTTPKTPPTNMFWAMGLSAFACIGVGIFPKLLYDVLPFPVNYHPYTVDHILGALELLFATAGVFFFLKKYLAPRKDISLDLDWIYRKPFASVGALVQKGVSRYEGWITQAYKSVLMGPAKKIAQWAWNIDTWVVDGLVNGTGMLTLLESRVSHLFDVHVVDGAINGLATGLNQGSKALRRFQTGRIQNYLLAMIAGVLGLTVFFVSS